MFFLIFSTTVFRNLNQNEICDWKIAGLFFGYWIFPLEIQRETDDDFLPYTVGNDRHTYMRIIDLVGGPPACRNNPGGV